MNPVWKILLVLALVLPVGGFVAGSLVATSAGDPAPRAPMRINPAGETSTTPTPSGPSSGPRTAPPDREDPDDDRDARERDRNELVPVAPQPGSGGGDREDDDDGDDDDDDDDDDGGDDDD